MRISENIIEKFGNSVEKALADYAKVSEEAAADLLKKMSLNDYAALVAAIDAQNENEITKLVDKYNNTEPMVSESHYFENDINSIFEEVWNFDFTDKKLKSILECGINACICTKVVSSQPKYKHLALSLLPETFVDVYEEMSNLPENNIRNYLGSWLTENMTVDHMYDVATMKYIFEDQVQQMKQNLATMVGKSASMVKNPKITDPKTNQSKTIVQADRVSNTIATADDKGNVEIAKVDPMTKKQISLEGLKTLAGIK